MKEKIVSIVIPTYNMEDYLERCLNSVLTEETKEQTEIIVVNDGSKDKSLEIAKSYQQRFPDTLIVVDKSNGNYGSCVNKALEIATGKYFRILDADDWFDTDGFIKYVEHLQHYTVDMVITNHAIVYNNGKKDICNFDFKETDKEILIDSDDFSKINVDRDFVMHKITYSMALLKSVDLRLLEGISYTDAEYVFYPLANVRSVVFLDVLLYNYLMGRPGQTVSISSKKAHLSDLKKIVNRMIDSKLAPAHTNRLKAQQIFLTRVFAGYYHTLLVVQGLTKSNRRELALTDADIWKFDREIYERLNKIKTLGIPFIRYWRKYHIQVIFPCLYRLLHKVYYSAS